MQRSQSSTGTSKAGRKLNMDSFEWTDEAITKFDENTAAEESKGASPGAKVSDGEKGGSALPTEPEDMDLTIARVQKRKKEEAVRKAKRDALPKPPARAETILSTFVLDAESGSGAEDMARALNTYFTQYMNAEQNQGLLNPTAASKYPLHFYDSFCLKRGRRHM